MTGCWNTEFEYHCLLHAIRHYSGLVLMRSSRCRWGVGAHALAGLWNVNISCQWQQHAVTPTASYVHKPELATCKCSCHYQRLSMDHEGLTQPCQRERLPESRPNIRKHMPQFRMMPSQLAQHLCLLLQLFTSLMGLLGPKTDSKVSE